MVHARELRVLGETAKNGPITTSNPVRTLLPFFGILPIHAHANHVINLAHAYILNRSKDSYVDLKGQQWLTENAASVLDAVVDAIVTIDSSGIIQSLNAATQTLFEYSPEELVGKPVTTLMPEPHKSNHQA